MGKNYYDPILFERAEDALDWGANSGDGFMFITPTTTYADYKTKVGEVYDSAPPLIQKMVDYHLSALTEVVGSGVTTDPDYWSASSVNGTYIINSGLTTSRVGIGTNSPNKQLTVVGAISGTSHLNIDGDIIQTGVTSVFSNGDYLEAGTGYANAAQLTFNANHDGGVSTNTYTPVFAGNSSAGMTVIKMPSGGYGGLEFYIKNHGTTSGSQNLSTFTKILDLNQDGNSTFAGGVNISGVTDVTNLKIGGAQGSDGQVLTSTGSGIAWEDSSGGGGGMTSFTVDADNGTPQTITNGNTLTIEGSTGIDCAVAATDRVLVAVDMSGVDSYIMAATNGTSITVDGANDKLAIYDNDASEVKYITANQLVDGGTF